MPGLKTNTRAHRELRGTVARQTRASDSLVFALFCVLSPVAASAADAASVSVSATVLSKNVCKFRNPTSAALSFGTIDPASGANATASATLTIRCGGSSATVSYALTHDSGLYETGVNANRMKHDTLDAYLPYALTLTPASGSIPKNTVETITISGEIAPVQFQDAPVGAYADSVVVTVEP